MSVMHVCTVWFSTLWDDYRIMCVCYTVAMVILLRDSWPWGTARLTSDSLARLGSERATCDSLAIIIIIVINNNSNN
jgi:hypothetical protein